LNYVDNCLDTQGAIDFFAGGLIKAPFTVGKLSKLAGVFQLIEKGKISGRYVLDTIYPEQVFQSNITRCM